MIIGIHFCMCSLILFALCLLNSTTDFSTHFTLLCPGKRLASEAVKNLLSNYCSDSSQISVLLWIYHAYTIYSRTEVNAFYIYLFIFLKMLFSGSDITAEDPIRARQYWYTAPSSFSHPLECSQLVNFCYQHLQQLSDTEYSIYSE